MVTAYRPHIPDAAYERYRLAYNNTTYSAVRRALDEAATFGTLHTGQSNAQFILDAMNTLIDASFERCGAAAYESAESKLHVLLRPLDSRILSLALRHLDNFGASRLHQHPLSPFLTSDALNVLRAELSGYRHEAALLKLDKATLATEWLRAAALLVGAAADLLLDSQQPSATWRVGAQDKLRGAFDTLTVGIQVAHELHYPLPDELAASVSKMQNWLLAPEQHE